MKLSEYIKENNCVDYNQYQRQKYKCKVHDKELIIEDGYELINIDITWMIDPSVVKRNPYILTCYESLEIPGIWQYKHKKLIYCTECESNKNISFEPKPNCKM